MPRTRLLVFFLLAAMGCGVDLLTKHYVFGWLGIASGENVHWLIEDYVGIQTTLNRGALFGMGEGGSRIFAALSIVAAVGIVCWLFIFRAARSLWLTVSLGMIMGGILGNLYDRLGLWSTNQVPEAYQHAVRDWILFRAGSPAWSWPNFNIADSLLVIGAGMLLWQAYQEQDAGSDSKTAASQA